MYLMLYFEVPILQGAVAIGVELGKVEKSYEFQYLTQEIFRIIRYMV